MSISALGERYELGRRIGGGGMADVVEAYDHELDRRVAVKLLRTGSGDPLAVQRFAREAQMAAGLAHPNVVTVYDVGETDGQPYIVMELVDGRSLAEILSARGPLPVDRALAATDSLLAALAAAHERGLVHRDVKPANVLISRDGRVKLADFGIATALDRVRNGLTATGQVIGTPTYLSPEQVDGRPSTPRSDLYALGVVLYEMLAGVPPFGADHAVAVALSHRQDPVPSLDAHRSDLPLGLTALVGRALEKDPADRFADALEMREALDAIRRGRPRRRDDATLVGAVPGSTRALPITPPPVQPGAIPNPATPKPSNARARTTTRRPVAGRAAAAVGLLGVAALLGAGAALLIARGGDPELQQTLTTNAVVIPALDVSVPTIPPTTTTLPTTIDGLIALVAVNPDVYGDRADDLLEELLDVRDDPDGRGGRAEHLARDIQRWVEDGEIDPTLGALALTILGVSPEGLAPGGQGPGGGDD